MTKHTHADALSPLWALLLLFALVAAAQAQTAAPLGGTELYEGLKAAALAGGTAEAKGLVLKRDRAALERHACECYARVRGEYERLFGGA